MTRTETSSATGLRRRTKITVSRDKMSAMLLVSSPQAGEPAVTIDEIHHELTDSNVTFGVDEAKLRQIIDENLFDQQIQVATGRPAIKGHDAQFEYLFETERIYQPHESDDGLVDYRAINFLQNVSAGDILVRKAPATVGVDGTGVDGKLIKAGSGRDCRFSYGQGCEESEDGLELRANVSGVVVYKSGNVSVTDVMNINGDVDFSVGNLECKGSLKVSGKVLTGFKLTVGGNLDVGDNIEDAQIKANGSVIIKGGFFGSGEGFVDAGGELVVKYAENQSLRSGANMTIGDELLNCTVVCQGDLTVVGQRGRIIGGTIQAKEKIKAAVIGSDAGTPTRLRIDVNTELLQRYQSVSEEMARVVADFERVKGTLTDLYRLRLDGKLDPKKVKVLRKLERFAKDAPDEIDSLIKLKGELETELELLRKARITALERIHPGVELHFGSLKRLITEEMDACIFMIEGNEIVRGKLNDDDPK